MSGPIVRTGTTPKFWANWDKAFGGDQASGGKKKAKKKTARKKPARAKAKNK